MRASENNRNQKKKEMYKKSRAWRVQRCTERGSAEGVQGVALGKEH